MPLCFLVPKERGLRALLKGALDTGTSRGYQHGPQRLSSDAKAAASATKKPVCKHRSLSTPQLLGTCVVRHCQGPVIQGQLPQENTQHASGWCNITPASAACKLAPHSTPLPALGAKSKAEPQELCQQRREREISPCSLRSSGLNLQNQLDVPCICGIPE